MQQHINIKKSEAWVNISIKWKPPETFGTLVFVFFILFSVGPAIKRTEMCYQIWHLISVKDCLPQDSAVACCWRCGLWMPVFGSFLSTLEKPRECESFTVVSEKLLLYGSSSHPMVSMDICHLGFFVVVWVSLWVFWLWGWFFFWFVGFFCLFCLKLLCYHYLWYLEEEKKPSSSWEQKVWYMQWDIINKLSQKALLAHYL